MLTFRRCADSNLIVVLKDGVEVTDDALLQQVVDQLNVMAKAAKPA